MSTNADILIVAIILLVLILFILGLTLGIIGLVKHSKKLGFIGLGLFLISVLLVLFLFV